MPGFGVRRAESGSNESLLKLIGVFKYLLVNLSTCKTA